MSLISTLIIPMLTLSVADSVPSRIFIGTYTGKTSEGIYTATFDPATGKLGAPTLAAKTENPSFLAIHSSKPILYAVGEASDGGTISAFKIDPSTGQLSLINRESTVGKGPCHVAVSPNGKHAAVANYGGGSTALLPIADDGTLSKASAFIQHTGKGPDPKRQEAPHAHAVYFDKAGTHLFVNDLGLDKLLIYDYDSAKGSLTPHTPAHAAVDPGAGPRHSAFHPSAPYAYVLNEMGNTVTAFNYDAEKAALTSIQSIPTLPADFTSPSTTAEIFIHPNGKFLNASNRGHDSIATFTIDQSTGKLTAIGHTLTQGKTPRNFNIDPHGKFLLAANQNSGNIVAFQIDQSTGQLTPTGQQIEVGSPVCIVFVGH
jgi:6-phosphogluconolactonase